MKKKGKFDFIGFIFPRINFSGKTFSKPVYFVGATFQAETNFEGAIFKETVKFIGTKFELQGAWFTETHFEGEVFFLNTIFFITWFSKATFQKFVLFDGVEFLGGVFSMEPNSKKEYPFGTPRFGG
jgi:uncharacterized protein YjbI with pentapeptide repeats